MSSHENTSLRMYQQEVAALAAEFARLFRQGTFGIDELHQLLAERCRTHPLVQDAAGCDQVLGSSAFATLLRVAGPQSDDSLSAFAIYALQSDVTLSLIHLHRVPLRP